MWDRSGEPDPEIQKLESLLGKFRHDSPTPSFSGGRPRTTMDILSLAAAIVSRFGYGSGCRGSHRCSDISGVQNEAHANHSGGLGLCPTCKGHLESDKKRSARNEGTSRLGIGQMLETDRQSRASLQADDTGKIEVDPSTRLRLLSMGSGLKRIALDRGTIHAYIWAPPGQFVVDTPSAVTVDLGCAYTLQVDDSGAGMVRTSLGWVGFKLNGHESFIPAGAACATRPKVGPGTPYFEDASAEFRSALARFDFEDSTPEQRAHDVAIVLSEARNRDALTLWHLLARVDEGQRVLVYDRLSQLVPPPATVTKEGILRLDQPMLDLWWNELGFDDISVWRHWERSWAGTATPVREK